MPKYHWLPFLLECMSGSRALSLFLVEVGAAIKVASTTVPVLRSNPRWLSNSLTVARIVQQVCVFPGGGENEGWWTRQACAQILRAGQTRGTAACRRRLLPLPDQTG